MVTTTNTPQIQVLTPPQDIPWRTRLNTWARAAVQEKREAGEDFTYAELADLGVAEFGSDAALMGALLRSTLHDLVRDIAQQVVHASRTGASRGGIPIGNTTISQDQFKQLVAKKIETRAKVWRGYIEHVNGRQIPLQAMTRIDLLAAADSREKQAGIEAGYARLWRSLAEGLKDGQTVGDVYDEVEIQRKQDAILAAAVATQNVGKRKA